MTEELDYEVDKPPISREEELRYAFLYCVKTNCRTQLVYKNYLSFFYEPQRRCVTILKTGCTEELELERLDSYVNEFDPEELARRRGKVTAVETAQGLGFFASKTLGLAMEVVSSGLPISSEDPISSRAEEEKDTIRLYTPDFSYLKNSKGEILGVQYTIP